MVVKLSDYIVSPLAMGTRANYECVKAGETRLCTYVGKWGLPEPFVASMMDDSVLADACLAEGIDETYTKFERMAILAAARALQGTGVRPDDKRVCFIIATTKGNVGLLDEKCHESYSSCRVLLTEAARQITGWFHNPNEPLVVCNACISGLSAQMAALRMLEAGYCSYAVVIGADVLSPFIVSGFQSLKALSDNLCRPFDEERTGLNLGEAAACIVYARTEAVSEVSEAWQILSCASRNDAFHVSSPSKTAEGAFRSLKSVLDRQALSDLAFVNVHGTATLFNDEMEAVALSRAGLDRLPANGLKGYFGHTLGASGVLETLISMEALDDHIVLATKGFENLGVSRNVNLSHVHRKAVGISFLKMMSGFGGCNAAIYFGKRKRQSGDAFSSNVPVGACNSCHQDLQSLSWTGENACTEKAGSFIAYTITHTVHVTEHEAVVDGERIETEGCGMDMLKELYQKYVRNYPKYYKMDPLCKLGFIASELLLESEAETEGVTRFVGRADRAVIIVGRSASLCADRAYQNTIRYPDEYYPSPSAFIYTLPNILTGEIAIRNHYHGETNYVLQDNPRQVRQLMAQAFADTDTDSVIGGWIEIENTEHFEATLYILKKDYGRTDSNT